MKQLSFAIPVAAAISVGLALAIFGLRIADPHDVSWMTLDTVTSQFGWEQYRRDSAHFFPIISDRYSWPLTMPLAMFDPIPLISLLVKLVVPIGPSQIQYFGPVFLIGIVLQAVFAWLLLREATRGRTERQSGAAYGISLFLGTLFFTTAPILLVRFYLNHMSLTQQWPLIASLWLYARSNRVKLRQSLRDYTILEFVTASINPYVMVMTLMIFCSFILKSLLDKSIGWRNILYCLIPVMIGALALVTSGFINPLGASLIAGEGYGFFSANLYSPFNPMAQQLGSAFLPELKTAAFGQYEGYGYLGLGAILLLVCSLVFARIKGDTGEGRFPPLLVMVFIAYLLAISAHFTFGRYSFNVVLPQKVFDLLIIFRASGRFIWVVEYSLLFIGIASLIRLAKPQHAAVILALAAMVQVADLAGPLATMHQRFAHISGSDRFRDPAFQGLSDWHDTLIVLPAWQCQSWVTPQHDYPNEIFMKFSALAIDNHLRTNTFYAGRTPLNQAKYHCTDFPATFEHSPAYRHTAYLLSKRSFQHFGAHISASHYCDFAEDMFICRGDLGKSGLSERAQAASTANLPQTAP
jgi:hypothetical protein